MHEQMVSRHSMLPVQEKEKVQLSAEEARKQAEDLLRKAKEKREVGKALPSSPLSCAAHSCHMQDLVDRSAPHAFVRLQSRMPYLERGVAIS